MRLVDQIKHEVEAYRDYLLTDDPFLSAVSQGKATPLLLKHFIENVRYLVEHTPKHLLRATKLADKQGNPALAEFFRHKLDEEAGHDKWAEDDLKIVEAMSAEPLPDVSIDPKMESLLEHIEATIDSDPTCYLAYILFTEYLAVLVGPELTRGLEEKCGFPKKSLTVIENHAELDKEHVSEWEHVYQNFVDESRYATPFLETVERSIRIHRQFMANCAAEPEPDKMRITIDPAEGFGQWVIDRTQFRGKQTIGDLDIYYCGLKATHPKFGEALGADANVGSPGNGAWFELLERMSILEARGRAFYEQRDLNFEKSHVLSGESVFPTAKGQEDEFRYSLSNGVAIHSTWEDACRAACLELVERHLVLQSWVGGDAPKKVKSIGYSSELSKLSSVYTVERYEFGSAKTDCYSERISAAMTVLRPNTAENPLVFAFGAAFSLEEALQKSEKEVIQRLVFLWGEELPKALPPFAPNQIYHQEFFLYPGSQDKFEAWLQGEYRDGAKRVEDRRIEVSFANLSVFSSKPYFVAKAISKNAIPLVFGRWREQPFTNLADERLIHPVA